MVIIIIITVSLWVFRFLTAGNVNIYLIASFHDCRGPIITVSFQEKIFFACKLTLLFCYQEATHNSQCII